MKLLIPLFLVGGMVTPLSATANKIQSCNENCDFTSVEVFELSGVPVDTSTAISKNIHVYRVNLLDKVEAKLSTGMDKITTTGEATELINSKSVEERNHYYRLMKAGWRNLIRADYFGISKVPAVVFDHKYVIYGESLPNAIKIMKEKRTKQ
ncbi:DUF1525 domain-containing protein [Motilimonas cestriensis]|uniref:DUF1525 domain-containing protein n=1 Tax=Motilimonas cestriensis TaxID=2742685 RepID=UPI003DA4FEEA